jgi:enterochelin esterase-like enzyme
MKLRFLLPLVIVAAAFAVSAQVGAPAQPAPPLAVPSSTVPPPAAADDREKQTGPDYTPAPELTVKEGVPKGTIHEFEMDSKDSKIYPGISKASPGITVPYKRKVSVYVPAGYAAGKEMPFIVCQDGIGYKNRMYPILDNLIAEKRIPAMIAVMIDSGGGDSKGSERGLEYDAVSETYTNFIETEVLPKIEKDYNVKFTKDPNGRATMGGSSGAACAFTMAWFRPDLYRKVLSYSGTYVAQEFPENPKSPRGAWEYHAKFIPESPAKPIRIWLQISDKDLGWDRPEESWHNWVLANQRMLEVLKKKGYDYQYVFSNNAKHVDDKVVRQTLPDALVWLWRGYPAK